MPAPRADAGRHDLATVVRFLLVGGTNTAATLLLYWLLLGWLVPRAAYAVSFAAGMVLGYLLNTRFVFRVRRQWRSLALFPLVHLATYVVGALALELAIGWLHIDPRVAPLLSIAATVPTSYLLTHSLLRNGKSRA